MVKHAGGALLPSLSIDRTASVPIGTQLCSGMRELILAGDLRPGERLPSSRTLAKEMGVSRTTAVGVYERLAAEGLVTSRVGAGAFVSETLQANQPAPAIGANDDNASVPRQPPRLARLAAEASEQFFPRLTHPVEPRAFVTGMPAFDEFPMALWARLMAKYWRQSRNLVLGYPEPGGLMTLRRAIAAHLGANRGVACEPEQIFIVNGAQQAFNRIASVLIDPGDAVWFENPGGIGARNGLLASGARLVPIPVDGEGLCVAAGRRAAPDFRLAFVTPSHQQPLGVTMSLARRLELLRAAERAQAWVVEDDYDGEFHYGGRPLPTLKSVDTAGRVIYVGTFSKSLFPALRLGYLVTPPELTEVFDRVSSAILQGAPTSLQSVVASFIEEGHFNAHIRRMREIYAERQAAFQEAATWRLAGLLEVAPTDTGFQTMGLLAPDLDEREAAEGAARRGITVAPLARFCIEPLEIQGLALGFSCVKPREIAGGVETLAQVLEGQAGPGRA